MQLGEIYQLAINEGIAADYRGEKGIKEMLARQEKKYRDLKEEDKAAFDQENLSNPFNDTRILYGDSGRKVNTILAGIDIEAAEVLMADRLREKGTPIDLIMAHHPEGKALAALHEVMHLQEDILHILGVPINVAEGILSRRIGEVKRGLMPVNHNRTVDAAKIFDIPLMCVHTPADNLVSKFLDDLFNDKKPETVGDVVTGLKGVPEYQKAMEINAGPTIILGSSDRRAGKIFVDMTGGTGGSEDAYEKLAQAGVGTIVGMHMGEKHRKEAEKNHLNVVIAGHIASDSLGMNLFLDSLAAKGIEIITCSGLTRVTRG
ncbi:NGG1p interacting factor NIF3 [Metallumcola ferriviriculae]|uniref:NGG1p interacting factor NIF3 n=1 Tax=Metallumcola ferriviriculae TaxID=3039180 RepID=A0AAU0USK6_9FIRM|nr:NGG1p interacting factor NIF3 [Desulfitibacteraceae bacterium MK1]